VAVGRIYTSDKQIRRMEIIVVKEKYEEAEAV